jgi:hypothetical protein
MQKGKSRETQFSSPTRAWFPVWPNTNSCTPQSNWFFWASWSINWVLWVCCQSLQQITWISFNLST